MHQSSTRLKISNEPGEPLPAKQCIDCLAVFGSGYDWVQLLRITPKLSADSEFFSVLRKECGRWRDSVGGKFKRLSLKRLKAGFHGLVGEARLEAGGEYEAKVVIECDEPLVEGRIVESVERDAVADVEAFRFVTAPLEDVGGDEQLADGQAGDGTAVAVVVEDDFAEVILPAALFGGSSDLGLAGGRAGDSADAGAGYDFGGLGFGFGEEGVETLLAERSELGGVLLEFFPDGAVEIAGTLEAFYAAELEHGIQRGEVAEFHRHGAGRATDAIG